MGDLKDDVRELKELVKDSIGKKKEKKFRLPFGKKVGRLQKRKNYVTLIKINENSQIDFKKIQINDQTFIEDGIPRLAAAGYVMYWKKNPFIILPSWSVEPFSPLENYKQSLNDGSNSVGYKLLMNRMQNEQIKPKVQIGGWLKWIIIAGILGIIGYAFISGGI